MLWYFASDQYECFLIIVVGDFTETLWQIHDGVLIANWRVQEVVLSDFKGYTFEDDRLRRSHDAARAKKPPF